MEETEIGGGGGEGSEGGGGDVTMDRNIVNACHHQDHITSPTCMYICSPPYLLLQLHTHTLHYTLCHIILCIHHTRTHDVCRHMRCLGITCACDVETEMQDASEQRRWCEEHVIGIFLFVVCHHVCIQCGQQMEQLLHMSCCICCDGCAGCRQLSM